MKQRGFTLIEAMITVVIIGILGAIVYPSYVNQVLKSGRSDAKVALNDAVQRMQRCFTANGKFNVADGVCTVVDSLKSDDGLASNEGYYTLTVSNLTGTSYTITAAAVSGKRQAQDLDCATFSVTQAGVKTSKSSTNDVSTTRCW